MAQKCKVEQVANVTHTIEATGKSDSVCAKNDLFEHQEFKF